MRENHCFGVSEMSLREMGLALHEWHSGQFDPVYMTGSFFVDGRDYPDLYVVEEARDSLQRFVDKVNSDILGSDSARALGELIDALTDYLDTRRAEPTDSPNPENG